MSCSVSTSAEQRPLADDATTPAIATFATCGFLAVTSAATTYFSASGIHCLMNSALSSFMAIFTASKPALTSNSAKLPAEGAPATQQASASAVRRCSGMKSVFDTTSLMAIRPPGFSTRNISRHTLSFSGERFMTQLLMTASNSPSVAGRCSISPSRYFTLGRCFEFSRAFASISCVMSTPTTAPASPTSCAASMQSTPAPHPRSRTLSSDFNDARRTGVPHPTPRFALATPERERSEAEYPTREGETETQHDPSFEATAEYEEDTCWR
mmetsp:Transcript_11434/g.30239  ORF Transcript_11434/g.30239 Transcript_11434/m.30239 type:complete len:269 (-) Transcript_11434:215-1021(-)